MTRRAPRRWVGVDGEGLGRSPHRYALLAASDGTTDWTTETTARAGLTTGACLAFLYQFASLDVHVGGFYFDYDWTMILRELPARDVYRLFRPELRALSTGEGGGFSRVLWRGWRLHYLARSMRIERGGRGVTVWDLGTFYQQAFVKAISDWGIRTPEQIAKIDGMKAQRDKFTRKQWPAIRSYCLDECRALAELATTLESTHRDVGILPRSWYGPGSTASVVLRQAAIHDKRGEIPAAVADAAKRAFFGGRFEHSTIGLVPEARGYDIASAYPFAASRLPCLEHATWEWRHGPSTRKPVASRTSLVRFAVDDIGDKAWAPLPCRLANGNIVYARGGFTGWTWRDEFLQACAGWRDGIRFLGAWELCSVCDCRPFAFIEALYEQRLTLGKDVRGKVVKLAMNSAYGKLAQSIGRPRYASRVWAGMITSSCRAQLLDHMRRADSLADVVAVATDGLYSRSAVPGALPVGAVPALGDWETKPPRDVTLVRPGIYFGSDDAFVRARGVGRRELAAARDKVLAAIAEGAEKVDLGGRTTFGGAKATVYRTPTGVVRKSGLYGTWHQIPSRLSLSPGPKRASDWRLLMLPGVESQSYGERQSDAGRTMALVRSLFAGTM